MYSGEVPFNEKGELQSYPESWREIEWRPNKVFESVMIYGGYGRGRSSALIYLYDMDDRRWPVFMSDADQIIPLMTRGEIRAKWAVCKKGQNYGLQMVPDEPADPRTETKREGVEL